MSAPMPARAVIELVAALVPAYRREEWLTEWRGELSHAWTESIGAGEAHWRARARLAARALGSLADALFLRRAHGGGGGWRWKARDAVRGLRRRPSFALAVIATLSLGVGSATAIFSAVDALLLRPLPFRDPGQLVWLRSASTYAIDPEAMDEWRRQDQLFTELRAYGRASVIVTEAGEPRSLGALLVEPGFMRMLGIAPLIGRDFGTDETRPGSDRVTLVSEELWRTALGGERSAIGRTIRFDGEPYTVIGVLPAALRRVPDGLVDVVMPLTDPPPYDRLLAMARLRTGIDIAAARTRAEEVATLLQQERPRERGWDVTVDSLRESTDARTRLGLKVLSGAVLFLLLIACANAAGLLFVRGVARQPEMSLRLALGGSRAALFRHVLSESLLLALLSGALGALIARWGVRALVALAPSNLVRFSYNAVQIDARVIGFAFVLTLATGLVFGLVPALRASRASAARAGRSATASPSQVRVRSAVQVLQLALVVLLLSGAGLLGRSLQRLLSVEPGYDAERVLLLNYFAPATRGAQEGAIVAFNRRLDERLRGLPGVQGVGWSNGTGIRFDDHYELEDGTRVPFGSALPHTSVDTSFFRVMGIPILEGRAFEAGDLAAGSDAVIIDRDLAALLWPGSSAVGRRMRIGEREQWYTIVGVSGDFKLEGPDDPYGAAFMFHPMEVAQPGAAAVVVRTSGDPAALARVVRETVWEIDPAQPIWKVLTGRQKIAEAVALPRFLLIVTTVFATAALLLAAIGVYGLIAFTVAQRTREIGVRIALGAQTHRVTGEVVGSGMRLALLGAAIGLAGAVALSRLIEGLLFGVSPVDAPALLIAMALLLVSCLFALLGPARRAAAIDPASALRAE